MKPALLVLAAGMGSRYGGIKQIEPVGPSGEIILEYSVYDAIRAGFDKAVFVIRRDIERDFTDHVLTRFDSKIQTEVVFQDLHDLPQGYTVPEGRQKPWGTGHAVLSGSPAISQPFAVINADDFYGSQAFDAAGRFLSRVDSHALELCMVGYRLDKTVSDHGTVSRGLCQVDARGYLQDVEEHTTIEKTPEGIVSHLADGTARELAGDETVSMNLFGFTPPLLDRARSQFKDFLDQHGDDQKAEFYIPKVVNTLIHSGEAQLSVLQTDAQWFGITYQEDRPRVIQSIRTLVDQGRYPSPLWS